MLFPESPRVIYKKNPLTVVICQLRFPTILKVGVEPPVAFQEAIRDRYPFFDQERPDVPAGLPDNMLAVLKAAIPKTEVSYKFISADKASAVTLARDFLALETNNYNEWRFFRSSLEHAVNALNNVYSPAFFTRVGLRYQDAIRRSSLGLEGVGWGELIQPQLAGVLSAWDVSSEGIQYWGGFKVDLEHYDGKVTLQHGLGDSATDGSHGETCYVIDADFYRESKTELSNVYEVLDAFNKDAGRLFRWSIKDRLHNAMDPQHAD